jgi:holin-like protein
VKITHLFYTITQIVLISCLLWACNLISNRLGLSVPGSVLGLAILATLLITGVIQEKWIALGAAWLLADMLLFFVPAVVSVLKYRSLLGQSGLSLMSSVLAGTITVMLGTAWVVDRVFAFEHKRLQEKQNV